jgi:5-carboxymethyl-2-hydroxymuconate isomerase
VKLARIEWADGPRLAIADDDGHLVPLDRDLSRADLTSFDIAAFTPVDQRVPLSAARFLPPVPDPGKIIAVGLNYVDHAAEAAIKAPEAPLLFAKTANALLPHNGVVVGDPLITSQVDFEGELALVIGRTATRVPVATALDHVFAYTVGNDVSARDVQFGDGQWMRGKSLDTFCPLGPCLVTADEIADPQALRIVTTVNDAVMQDESTGSMIFSVAEIVSYVSRSITLAPGDVILTGTPAGVGFARTPSVFLADGDVVSVSIEPIGTLRNTVRIG